MQSAGLKPEENAIAAPVPLRSDSNAQALGALAKQSRDPVQTSLLLALSVIPVGDLRLEEAEICGIGLD
jgi:hypothetical protein